MEDEDLNITSNRDFINDEYEDKDFEIKEEKAKTPKKEIEEYEDNFINKDNEEFFKDQESPIKEITKEERRKIILDKIANGQLKNSYGQAIEKISNETQTNKM